MSPSGAKSNITIQVSLEKRKYCRERPLLSFFVRLPTATKYVSVCVVGLLDKESPFPACVLISSGVTRQCGQKDPINTSLSYKSEREKERNNDSKYSVVDTLRRFFILTNKQTKQKMRKSLFLRSFPLFGMSPSKEKTDFNSAVFGYEGRFCSFGSSRNRKKPQCYRKENRTAINFNTHSGRLF